MIEWYVFNGNDEIYDGEGFETETEARNHLEFLSYFLDENTEDFYVGSLEID